MFENYTYFDENQQLHSLYYRRTLEEDPFEPFKILQWLFIQNAQMDAQTVIDIATEIESSTKRNRTTFIGLKQYDGWSELYFYLFNAKGFEGVAREHLHRNNISKYEIGTAKEKQMKFYYDSLLPNAWMQLQIQSKQTIDALKEAGDAIEEVHLIEHYLLFATESLAQKAAHLLKERFTIVEIVQSEEQGYALVCEHRAPLLQCRLFEKDLYDAATSLHGHYEGWSTQKVHG